MKTYTINVDEELTAIYEDITKFNNKSIEETLQVILKRVVDTLLKGARENP